MKVMLCHFYLVWLLFCNSIPTCSFILNDFLKIVPSLFLLGGGGGGPL